VEFRRGGADAGWSKTTIFSVLLVSVSMEALEIRSTLLCSTHWLSLTPNR